MTVLVVGGYGASFFKTTEIVPKSSSCSSSPIPHLPYKIDDQPSLIQTQIDEILLCGGFRNEKKCLELKNNTWQEHSSLKYKRTFASAVSMPGGVYVFGGDGEGYKTWEWMESGKKGWQSGKTSIPGGFDRGCAVKINENEIVLIGSPGHEKRVLKFNTLTQDFENLGEEILRQERWGHACTRVQDEIIITGGWYSSSTEIININNLTTTTTLGGNLRQPRYFHGLVYNDPTLLAVGGTYREDVLGLTYFLDSIEKWNPSTKTWTMMSEKLHEQKSSFGILSMPKHLLCSM